MDILVQCPWSIKIPEPYWVQSNKLISPFGLDQDQTSSVFHYGQVHWKVLWKVHKQNTKTEADFHLCSAGIKNTWGFFVSFNPSNCKLWEQIKRAAHRYERNDKIFWGQDRSHLSSRRSWLGRLPVLYKSSTWFSSNSPGRSSSLRFLQKMISQLWCVVVWSFLGGGKPARSNCPCKQVCKSFDFCFKRIDNLFPVHLLKEKIILSASMTFWENPYSLQRKKRGSPFSKAAFL